MQLSLLRASSEKAIEKLLQVSLRVLAGASLGTKRCGDAAGLSVRLRDADPVI